MIITENSDFPFDLTLISNQRDVRKLLERPNHEYVYLRASDKYKRSLTKNDTRPNRIIKPPRTEVTIDTSSICNKELITFYFVRNEKIKFLF